MSADSVVSIAWDVLKSYGVVPIKRRFRYVISSKSFAVGLWKEVRNLENEAEKVHVVAEVARNNNRSFYSEFMEWEAKAEEALKEARDLLADFEKASKTCCRGTLPDPKCRYQFSKKAEAKIEDIKQLAQKCSGFKGLDDISFSNPTPGNVAAPNPARREGKDVVQWTTMTASASSASTSFKLRDDGVFESRASVIRDIMGALADNSKSVVGVYGMGGVGKSTLLADAERKIREEKLFSLVAKAEVSENPDIKRIQGEIAHALGLDIKNEEFINVRADLLRKRLAYEERTEQENDEERTKQENDQERKKNKVLIILDNLWKGLDLKLVGIPCGYDNKIMGCKLLLTSRNRDVLRRGMGCEMVFRLDRLQEQEARRLFERMVGDKVRDDDFKPLVDESLHKCAGVPFLILAMAKRFKDASLSEWKDTLKQIETFKDREINEVINKMLQLSYDDLEEEAKLLLRLCVVYGISKPSLESLVRYGVGLELFRDVNNMEEARNRLSSLMHTLQASSLLLDDEDANGFKIHDLVREFVFLVASRDRPIFVFKDKEKWVIDLQRDKLKSCWAVCFPYIDMKEILEELDCPELQIFLMFTNDESLDIPDSYFNSMRKLGVLNLTGIRLIHSPLAFQLLENLHTLCLDGCSLEDVASLGNLKGLHILSFVNSKIHRLPKEIGQLVELRLLDLNHCSRLQVIEPGVLRSLIKLEELYVENSFDQWNAMEQTPPINASLIELNDMKNLCTLHVSIPNPSVLPEDLNIQKLTKYRIQIGSTWHQSSEYKTSRAWKLKLNPKDDILQKGCVQTTLDITNELYLDGLNGIEHSICQLSPEGFPKLKLLHVKNSPSIHYILRQPSHIAFKMLESLLLEDLVNLEKICHNHISSKSFSTLKVVRVKCCYKMEVLFPLSLLRELPQLEEIGVVDCNLMREIAEADDRGKVELHNLHILELCDLPGIKNFLTVEMAPSSSSSNDQVGTQAAFFNGQQVSIPSLETLTISRLPNLEDIWNDESPLGLSNLQSLKVEECKSLSKVISFRSLIKLHKLHTLTIDNCISVEEIFHLDGPNASGGVETLSELTTFHLKRLPSLRRIWNKNICGIMRFHNLKELEVSKCDNLRFLFSASMVKSLAQLRELKVWHCEKMEAIIMEEEGLEMETSEALAFPILTHIFLNLGSLTCFFCRKCSREARSQDDVKSHSTALFNQKVVFPNLERLHIYYLYNIEMIWDGPVAADPFDNLKSLYVRGCNKLVNIVPSCILGRLKSLESLSVEFCSSLKVVFEPQPLNSLDGHVIACSPLKNFSLGELPQLKCVWDNELHHQVIFQCLRNVNIWSCKSLTSLFPASMAKDLMHLEELKINDCGIVELIEKEGQVPKFVFPKLTSLKLKHLSELKCIYKGIHALRWLALKTLKVRGCNKVEILASQPEDEMPFHKQSLFLVEKGAFPNLQELKLDLSGQMEIWHGHFHDEELFCELRVLKLYHLSMESAISTCRFVQSLTNLENLVVCESYLKELNINAEVIEGLIHELKVIVPFSRYFQNLRTLVMSHCDGLSLKVILPISRYFEHLETLNVSHWDGLSNMFTPAIAKNLVKLTKLTISNCKMLIEVICDEGGKKGHVVAFNQLKYMELDGLTRLRCFGSGGYILKFPSLEDVIVTRCPSMKFFSEGPIEAPKLERVHLSTAVWLWKGNLNITIEEMATVAGVEFMWLSEFPELIGKWHSELNPIKSSWQLKSLVVDKCPSFINIIPSRLMLVLDNLERLLVIDCDSLEEIFDLEGLDDVESTRVLPNLRSINLVNLPKLSQLGNKNTQGALRFNGLGQLTLYNCGNLRHAFTPSMARFLANIRWIKINECAQMEGLIAEEEGQGSAMEKITFSRLLRMELECLPHLTSFLSGKNHVLECPKLTSLTIAHCPQMRSLTWQSLMEIDHDTTSLFTPRVQFPQLQSIVLSHMDNLSKIWTHGLQGSFPFEQLRRVEAQNCKNLENLFPHWVATSLTQLKKLQMESCGLKEIVMSVSRDDIPHSIDAEFFFPNLTSLVLHNMPQLQSFCANLPTLNWPFLKELRVTHCDKLKMLSFVAPMSKWTQNDDQHEFSFERGIPTLETLLLNDKDIHTIQNGKFSDDFFGKPKVLTLACFHDENAVFPPMFLLQRFHNLQSLEVFCSSFEDIFLDEGLVDEGKHLVLENLEQLKLKKLHNLKHVWREGYLVAKILQSIGTFEIWDCPNLTTLFPAVTSFRNLTKLVVKNSSGLVHLVTVSAITNLVHLTDMTIIGCERMKEVVANDENKERKVISLTKLLRLTLQHLSSLECFSSTTYCIFRFPNMYSIEVEECPKMKIFCKGMISTPKLQRATLFRCYWDQNWKGDLNTTIQKLTA